MEERKFWRHCLLVPRDDATSCWGLTHSLALVLLLITREIRCEVSPTRTCLTSSQGPQDFGWIEYVENFSAFGIYCLRLRLSSRGHTVSRVKSKLHCHAKEWFVFIYLSMEFVEIEKS